MAEQAALTKTSSNGQLIEVRLYQQYPGSHSIEAYLDGKYHGRGFTTFGRPKLIGGKSYVAAINKIALTESEYDSLRAAIEAANLATPEGRMNALKRERGDLAANIRGILDDTEHARNRAFDDDLGRIPSYDSPEYRAAMQALADFDAVHPDVLASIKAEREADRRQFEAYD